MTRSRSLVLLVGAGFVAALLLVLACGGDEEPASSAPAGKRTFTPVEQWRAAAEAVDDARLVGADADTDNWLTHGRTYGEPRFSPLDQINDGNVAGLRLVWSFPTGMRRGHEATPLVLDGVMYFTGPWSVVFALDASTGKQLWKYDPKVNQEVGRKTCCDVVNRGVALYKGRVYVGVLDGRLVALDAATGKPDWEVVTVDQSLSYTVTGAPRVVDGKVVIGNGGAEFGVRGYISAYDAGTGELAWRTYTVPGDPSKPFESKALEEAAKTWSGEYWAAGGGGTVWDSMAYDPDLHLLYVGTGNGSPWRRELRSPGGGDNLYLSSILALDPDDGELVWYYQTTPGDNWDYTATQHMILAEIMVKGQLRKVLMQAPKNGFFYVLDRETGELLSVDNYVDVSWAEGVDLETGRPVFKKAGEYEEGLALVQPWYLGGHNWHPMSYSPETGLVYIPAQVAAAPYKAEVPFVLREPGRLNTGVDFRYTALFSRELVSGHLLAWDPVAQREVWRHPHGMPWNGGTLATAGNLVFQGTADGRFLALRADDGRLLWQSHSAGTGIIAAPITYKVGGVQYVTVVAGWGGAFAQIAGDAAAAANVESRGRVITYALVQETITPEVIEAIMNARNAETRRGSDLYHLWCARCHGSSVMAAGVNPDLRDSISERPASFAAIVENGLPGTSMPSFGGLIDADGIREIEKFVLERAAAAR